MIRTFVLLFALSSVALAEDGSSQLTPPQIDPRFHVDALEAIGANQWKDLGRLNAIANQLLMKTREQEKEIAELRKKLAETEAKMPKSEDAKLQDDK